MKKNWILAILLNAFVMPGFGHYLLKEKLRATILSTLTLIVIVIPAVAFTSSASKYILNAKMSESGYQTMTLAMQKSAEGNKSIFIVSILFLLLIWTYSLADLIVRREKFKEEENNDRMQG